MHYWVRATAADFRGTPPQARSGHSAVNIGKLKVIVFGGLVDKRFLNDITVYDAENKLWFQPECTGSGSDGQVGPSPRAFHVAVAIDCHMFIFGGRSAGGKRLGDFWVLDTDIWQWSELTSFGDLPSPRDFASAAPIGNQKIVMYGGWDGKKWLSDVYLMDTISLEWIELSVTGSVPPPRCGHTTTMVEKRLLVFGGRGSGGPIMGDLWALKGLIEEENEMPGWTQLKLPGQPPAPRCGHTVTSGGHYFNMDSRVFFFMGTLLQLLLFGGHGTGGWLSRYDIYYSDCIVLDRVSVQWKRLPISNEAPPALAYHTMTSVGSRYLLFGGYDGKSTFGDFWWLVPDGDPIAKRSVAPSPESYPLNNDTRASMNLTQKGSQKQESAFSELWKKFEVSTSLSEFNPQIIDEVDEEEFIELARMLMEKKAPSEVAISNVQAGEVVREHWRNSHPGSVHLRELGPLLCDYQRVIKHHYFSKGSSNFESLKSALLVNDVHQFYHVRNPSQLRMDDIPNLLATYRDLAGL